MAGVGDDPREGEWSPCFLIYVNCWLVRVRRVSGRDGLREDGWTDEQPEERGADRKDCLTGEGGRLTRIGVGSAWLRAIAVEAFERDGADAFTGSAGAIPEVGKVTRLIEVPGAASAVFLFQQPAAERRTWGRCIRWTRLVLSWALHTHVVSIPSYVQIPYGLVRHLLHDNLRELG